MFLLLAFPAVMFYKQNGVAAVLVPCAVPCASGLSIATLVIETSFDLSWQMVPMTRASSCLGIKQLFRALLAASI